MDPNAEDLAALAVLRRTEPTMFTTDDGETYALAASIPPELLEAFETLTPCVKYDHVQAAWCLAVEEWLSCRARLVSKLMKCMTSRSLELGIIGPSPGDLELAPNLRSWIAVQDRRSGGAILIGNQTGHPTLTGFLINTSRLCGIDPFGTWARTSSRWYRLDSPGTADSFPMKLGSKVSALRHHMLEFWQVQALIADDQRYAGLRNG